MHVCQCLQMPSSCIHSASCYVRLIYDEENASPWRETEKSTEEKGRWVLTWPCPSLWLLLLGCTTRCDLRACGGTQSKWGKKSHDREGGMNRGSDQWGREMLEGGKGRNSWKNGIKKNIVVDIKNFKHNEFSQAFEESQMNLEQLVMKSPQKT